MRLSCNGCRVLRKGCSDACTIRPCLQWIKSPEAQANATVFLAKFYGRAGLLNLINAGADDAVRPAIFRSLLYEACGRIVNPVYGSVGLLWSGSWHLCQAAVEAVLKGAPIVQISDQAAAASPNLDIRHVAVSSKKPSAASSSSSQDYHLLAPPSKANNLLKVAKAGRTRFKRTDKQVQPSDKQHPLHHHAAPEDHHADDEQPSHDQMEMEASLDTDAEAGSHVSQAEQQSNEQEVEKQHLGLDLSLAFAPLPAAGCVTSPPPTAAALAATGWSAGDPGVVAFRFL